MKILWATLRSYPAFGGAEKHFYEFMKRLVKNGHQVVVVTTDILTTNTILTNRGERIKTLKEIKDGIIFRRYRRIQFPYDRRIAYYLSRFRNNYFLQGVFGRPFIWIPGYIAFSYISKESFDLVIAGPHPYYAVIYPALSFAKRKNTPFIDYALLHTGLPHSDIKKNEYVVNIAKLIMQEADVVIGNTEVEREIIKKTGLNPTKFYSIGAGVNPEEIKGGDADKFRKKYNIHHKMILQSSVQTEAKGTITLIESSKLLLQKRIYIDIVLIGELLSDVKEYYEHLPIKVKKIIKILGNVDEETKKDALAACDVFVMASRTDSFGIAYLEAWMYKKPVIGAYAGGIPYVIDDGINGYLVPFGDYHMLSEYIDILLKNRAIARKFGEEGYKKVINNYTWDIQYEKFRYIIDKFAKVREK